MQARSSEILTDVIEKLSLVASFPALTQAVSEAARALANADGATFVLRDGSRCYYIDETAIAPLWKGKRFPLESCISGWAILNKRPAIIEDIYADDRIPHDAYRPTFVRSLCMVPIRSEDPIGSIGIYWANRYLATPEEVKLLQVLANSAAVAIENLELRQTISGRQHVVEEARSPHQDFESALHTMAHDLRNPLATIMTMAELLDEHLKAKLGEQASHYLEAIIRTCSRSGQQINRMLALYKASNRDLIKQTVDVSSLGNEVFQVLMSGAPPRQVEFSIQPGLKVHADPTMMRLVLDNLFSNAIKYTSRKPQAKVEVGQLQDRPNMSTIYVRDNGDGFASTDVEKLFRPLVRLHEDADFSGTGLGLASVARIVERHGGQVRAEGKKSEGATFYVSLPIEAEI